MKVLDHHLRVLFFLLLSLRNWVIVIKARFAMRAYIGFHERGVLSYLMQWWCMFFILQIVLKNHSEYVWFSLSDFLPFFSVDCIRVFA